MWAGFVRVCLFPLFPVYWARRLGWWKVGLYLVLGVTHAIGMFRHTFSGCHIASGGGLGGTGDADGGWPWEPSEHARRLGASSSKSRHGVLIAANKKIQDTHRVRV